MEKPAVFNAFVGKLTVEQVSATISAMQGSPSAIKAMAATMTPERAGKVAVSLCDNPTAVAAMLAQFSTEKLVQMKVSLFLTDYAAWEKLSDFLNPPLQKRKTFSKNWMDAARAKLHDQIAKDGYTPDLLQEAQQLMQQATSK